MTEKSEVVAVYNDKFGDERVIHKTRHGLKKQRRKSTVTQSLGAAAGVLIGQRIRKQREAAGMTMEELCIRSGLVTSFPKSRIYEIEKSTRSGALHMGTLYAIALALKVPVSDLLPSSREVSLAAGVQENVSVVSTLAVT